MILEKFLGNSSKKVTTVGESGEIPHFCYLGIIKQDIPYSRPNGRTEWADIFFREPRGIPGVTKAKKISKFLIFFYFFTFFLKIPQAAPGTSASVLQKYLRYIFYKT